MSTARQHDGWDLIESGPADAKHRVLLLPGALATAMFYDEVTAEPRLGESSVRLVATTLPGFGRTPPPDDLSTENYARLASKLAADLGCGAVVGHSYGANVALEMAASGGFSGPLILISPSFSRQDEDRFLRAMDRVSSVFGSLPFALALKMMGMAMKDDLPADRRDALVAELKNNDPRFVRRGMRSYLEYLDRYGSLAPRLCGSGARAWVAFGDHDMVGLTDRERRTLEECPRVTLVTIADSGHMTLNEKPDRIADLILEMVSAEAGRSRPAA